MRDGRPNPDIWGNIITCGEIAVGIYEIVGTKKRGLEVPKAVAEEILPESVMEQAAQDGENLCFTDPVSNAIVADTLLEQELVTDPQAAARLDAIRQLDDVTYDTVCRFEKQQRKAMILPAAATASTSLSQRARHGVDGLAKTLPRRWKPLAIKARRLPGAA